MIIDEIKSIFIYLWATSKLKKMNENDFNLKNEISLSKWGYNDNTITSESALFQE